MTPGIWSLLPQFLQNDDFLIRLDANTPLMLTISLTSQVSISLIHAVSRVMISGTSHTKPFLYASPRLLRTTETYTLAYMN